MSLATASCARGSRCRALPGCRRGIRNTRSVCPGAATRRWSSSVQRERPRFREETLKRIATLVAGVDEQFVKDHSPLSPERRTPAWFLMQLYRPGESVLVFDDFKSQGRHVRQSGRPARRCRLSRPPRQRLSWRYLVLESDVAEPVDWLAALVQMPLRIAAFYTSGGQSIHALVRLDATSKADWDARARRLKPLLAVLGADPAAITAVRLTRLPGCFRGQDGPPASTHPRVPQRLARVRARRPIPAKGRAVAIAPWRRSRKRVAPPPPCRRTPPARRRTGAARCRWRRLGWRASVFRASPSHCRGCKPVQAIAPISAAA